MDSVLDAFKGVLFPSVTKVFVGRRPLPTNETTFVIECHWSLDVPVQGESVRTTQHYVMVNNGFVTTYETPASSE
jgi:hypothetical protein